MKLDYPVFLNTGIRFAAFHNVMKRLLGFLLLVSAWFAPAALRAQAPNDVFARIEAAIRVGDVETLSRFFNASVQVTTPEVDQDFSAVQAKHVLKEFFDKNKVRSFALIHRGQSGDSYYAMGEYQSLNGKYDVNLILVRNGNSFQLDIIRFEKGR